jgi:hypothetical protein
VGTLSATTGPNSSPGFTLSSTGTSGGVQAIATMGVQAEGMFYLSANMKASSATPTLVPFAVTFADVNNVNILTYTPLPRLRLRSLPRSTAQRWACLTAR